MKTATISLFGALVISMLALPSAAAPVSVTGEHDIGALLEQARATFDVPAEDAVLLLDRYSESWTADGRRIASVHTIVLIQSAQAINHYADLRIPYDSGSQELSVEALRTWRLSDQRWIVSGETARVETLPHALALAPDYSAMRETMLLHDGVELPCIVETAYSIADREPFRNGTAGSRIFARSDPSLRSEIVLSLAGDQAQVRAGGGAPQAVVEEDKAANAHRYSFAMGPVNGRPVPRTAELDLEMAHVSWSTWPSWQALARDLAHDFVTKTVVSEELGKVLDERLAEARTELEKAEAAVALAAESTRFINYAGEHFTAARPASRTWTTAYGHSLDRSVLAAALLHEAGFDATPAYRGQGFVSAIDGPPTMSHFEGPALWVSGEGFEGYFDPAAGELVLGTAGLLGRMLWRPGLDDAPAVPLRAEAASRAHLRLDLSWDGEAKEWTGTGVLSAGGVLSPFQKMQGLDAKRSQGFIEGLAEQVMAGAKVSSVNPQRFAPTEVVVGFALTVPGGERDGYDRLHLSLGDPGSALASPLPSGAQRAEAERQSTLFLPSAFDLVVELHLEPGCLELVHLPEAQNLRNEAGEFSLSSSEDDEEISVRRHLQVAAGPVKADAWPALRALLVADAHERSRTLLLR